jgi:hypothetical protein
LTSIKKNLADKVTGEVPSLPNDKCSHTPNNCCKNIHHDKFNKDPDLNALLSAFDTFTASYIADCDNDEENENATQEDNNANHKANNKDDDYVNALWECLVLSKSRQWFPWFPLSPSS